MNGSNPLARAAAPIMPALALSLAVSLAMSLALAGCASRPVSASACVSLAGLRIAPDAIGLPTGGAVVTSAEAIPAAAASAPLQAVAAHCKVLATVLPVDPTAPPILLQLNLPEDWNGATIQVGGGGLNGRIPANLAALGGSGSPVSGAQPPDAPYPINRGYAMFGSDSGHQGDAGDWALNDEAWVNFAHASLKKSHDAVFAIIAVLRGQRPRTSYFMGQSQGGREALEVAERYPADYDGVVATAPLIGYTAHVLAKTLLARAQTGAGWIGPEQARAVGAEVLRQCDALDGLADGVVSNTIACNERFDARALRCAAGRAAPDCLTDAQLATLAQMRAPLDLGFPLANGWDTVPGYGSGREAVAWLNITPQPRPGVAPALGQPGTTVQYGILKDPAADLLRLDPAAARARIEAASALIDSTSTDLSAFFARGGRLLIKSNAADYSVNPQLLADYVGRLRQRFGEATLDRHLRMYVLPGAGHNGEGRSGTGDSPGRPIAQHVDLVTMMTDWVEHGREPADAPVLRATDGATRPICRYPSYPHYFGGPPDDAASFRCVEPARRELLIEGERRVDVLVDGRGPVLVLLPSSLRDSLDFDDLAQRLAQRGYRVLRPQPPGMGRSSPPPPGMSLATLADDVALTIDRLGGGVPAVVVGHAYGHWVARVADMNHPARVRGVVALGAAAKDFPAGTADALAVAADPTQPEAARLAALQQVMFAPGNDPRPWLQGWHPEWRTAYRGAGQQPPREQWFGRSHAPILDLQGGSDPWRPAATRNELKDLLPDKVTVQVIGQASHALIPEQPEAVADAIDAWVRRLPDSR